MDEDKPPVEDTSNEQPKDQGQGAPQEQELPQMDDSNTRVDESDNNEVKESDLVTSKADIENDNVENPEAVDDEKTDNEGQDEEQEQTDANNNIVTDDLNAEEQNASDIEKDVETEQGGETTDNVETPSEQPERPISAPISPSKQAQQESDTETAVEPTKAPGSPTGTATTVKTKSGVRKHTTTPADDSGLVQPMLPAIPRGQVKVQQIASSISDARKKNIGQPKIYPTRNRVPPKLVRLATVTVSPAKTRPAAQGPSLYYEEPRRPSKVITWEEANNARPPLRIDMEGPGPCTYSPLNKPLNETNSPSYSFGTKCFPEKPAGIGARTSWGKSWFQSSHPYHNKADYVREGLWPSPTHYPKPNSIGPRQMTMYQAPSYTFGHKQEFSIIRPGAHKEPSPTDYERQNADTQVLKRGPSFSHQFRREGTVLWGCTESNPGPAAYTPLLRQRHQKPSYTIQGIRRSKSHILGPFSSI